jgi:predicted transcriptional regulator
MHDPNPAPAATDDAAEQAADARAEEDLRAGRVVPHEEVVKWLRSWGKPDELPCPEPKAS